RLSMGRLDTQSRIPTSCQSFSLASPALAGASRTALRSQTTTRLQGAIHQKGPSQWHGCPKQNEDAPTHPPLRTLLHKYARSHPVRHRHIRNRRNRQSGIRSHDGAETLATLWPGFLPRWRQCAGNAVLTLLPPLPPSLLAVGRVENVDTSCAGTPLKSLE